MSDQTVPPTQPPDKPLADARLRLEQKTTPREKRVAMAAGMVAAGVTSTKTAQALGLPRNHLAGDLKPYTQLILDVREKLKRRKMIKMQQVEAELWPRIQRTIAGGVAKDGTVIPPGDAKDVDALARAAMSFEKIQAQVSGEGQQINLKTEGDPLVDLKVLIQTILGTST